MHIRANGREIINPDREFSDFLTGTLVYIDSEMRSHGSLVFDKTVLILSCRYGYVDRYVGRYVDYGFSVY